MTFPDNAVFEDVHISKLRAGDMVVHDSCLKTVCSKDIRYNSFMGLTLWGDSYKLGTVPVRRLKCFWVS
jgi:hypothetical protein